MTAKENGLIPLTKHKEKALAAFRKLASENPVDNEKAHSEADRIILCYLVESEVPELAASWIAASEACGGFWYS